MGARITLGAALVLLLALAWLLAFPRPDRTQVFVEPTYERDRLEKLLALHSDLEVLSQSGEEEVTVRVEGVTDPAVGRIPRAAIRARHPESGYEVYALAEFLPVRNSKGGRARWTSSYAKDLREDDMADILHQVVLEAARQQHREENRPLKEVDRALRASEPAS